MMDPMLDSLTIFDLAGLTLVLAIVGVLIVLPMFVLLLFSIRKVEPGKAGVRVGFRGYIISDTWIFRIPLITRYDLMDISVQKLEIERKGQDGLICQDNIRADIVVAFYLKVSDNVPPKGNHFNISATRKLEIKTQEEYLDWFKNEFNAQREIIGKARDLEKKATTEVSKLKNEETKEEPKEDKEEKEEPKQ